MNSSCLKYFKTCVYEDVDETVLNWICTMQDKNFQVSGPFHNLETSKIHERISNRMNFEEEVDGLKCLREDTELMQKCCKSGENKDGDDNDGENSKKAYWIKF